MKGANEGQGHWSLAGLDSWFVVMEVGGGVLCSNLVVWLFV